MTIPLTDTFWVAVSGDGKVVAFGSTGAKFVSENTDPFDTSDPWDIFRVDIGPGGNVTNTLITKPVFGTTNVSASYFPLLSSTGNYVAFSSRRHYQLIGSSAVSTGIIHGYGAGTLPATIVTPPPALKFTSAPGQFTITWPDTASVSLYFKTNLADTVWSLVTNIPTLANGTNTVTLAPTGPARFFSLRSP